MVSGHGDELAEGHFASLFNELPVAVIGKTQEGTIVTWNPAAQSLYGYTPEEALGQPYSRLVAPEGVHDWSTIWRSVLCGQTVLHHETRHIRKGGTLFPAAIAVSPILGARGKVVGATTVTHDLTSVKAEEERQRDAAEASYRDLLEAAPDPVLIVDEAGVITLVNREAERAFGYQRDDLVGQPIELLVPDQARDAHFGYRSAYLASPSRRTMGVGLDLYAQRKDGTRFPVEISLSPTIAGGRHHVIAIARDATVNRTAAAELQAAHSALREQQQLLQQVIDVLPEGLIIADEAGRFVVSNDASASILGVDIVGSPMPITGQEAFGTRHEDGTPYEASDLPLQRSLLRGETVTGEQLLVRNASTGADVPLLLNSAPVRDHTGAVTAAVVAFQDISSIKELERRQERMLATVSSVLEGVAEPVFALHPDGHVAFANEAAAAFIHRPKEQLAGLSIRELCDWEDEGGRALDPHEYPSFKAAFSKSAHTETGLYFHKSSGQRTPVVVTANPILDGQQSVELVVVVVRDITRQREAEQLKDQIISLVSHELRTPIGHIMGFSSSLLEPDVDWNPATVKDFIGEIHQESQRLAALVTDLLDMSKIESGTDELNKGWHAPQALVERTLNRLRRTTANHNVLPVVAQGLPDVLLDGPRIERVLGNLVENAAKYAPQHTEIRVTAEVIDGEVVFCVADHGPGIAPQHQARVFERFYRVDRRVPGTGLGLAICKAIVEEHGGRMWLESGIREGTRCWFSLPLDAEERGHLRELRS